jgi:hypothetical protein
VVVANEDFDRQQLYALLEFIAPLVFPRPAYRTHTEDHVEWVKALFENDLEQLKRSSKTSERHFVQRRFSGDVERLGFAQAVVTTATISASARSPFTVRMELSPGWKQAWGLWLSN